MRNFPAKQMLAGATALALAVSPAIGRSPVIADSEDYLLEHDGLTFSYSYPKRLSGLKRIVTELEKRRDSREQELQQVRREYLAGFEENSSFKPHDFDASHNWQIVAFTPGYFSLSESWSSYTGGAHGIYGRNSMLWGKKSARPLKLTDIFKSSAAFDAALQPAFCKQLNIERSKRRGGEKISDQDIFGECLKPSEMTVFYGSSNGRKFDRIGLYAGPYVAGPYVEGAYEVTLPVNAKLLAALRPHRRNDFALGR